MIRAPVQWQQTQSWSLLALQELEDYYEDYRRESLIVVYSIMTFTINIGSIFLENFLKVFSKHFVRPTRCLHAGVQPTRKHWQKQGQILACKPGKPSARTSTSL